MSDQPKFNDKEAWKKIGNAVMFIIGAGCFFFWLANGPLLPDPNKVVNGRTVTTIVSNIHPEQITGFAGWMLHSGLLIIGVLFIVLEIDDRLRIPSQCIAHCVPVGFQLSPQLSGQENRSLLATGHTCGTQ